MRRTPHTLALELRRRPGLRHALVALVAGAAGLLTTAAIQRAEAARRAWGDTELVAVAVHELAPGDEVAAGDVELLERPIALVPDGAITDDPVGRVVHDAVFEGEVLVEGRLAERGRRGIAAQLPPGHRALALPREPGTTPDVEAGQRVDVIVVLAPEAAGEGPPGVVVAAGALVVDVTEDAVTVAVDADDATRVAVALAAGVVTIAVTGA